MTTQKIIKHLTVWSLFVKKKNNGIHIPEVYPLYRNTNNGHLWRHQIRRVAHTVPFWEQEDTPSLGRPPALEYTAQWADYGFQPPHTTSPRTFGGMPLGWGNWIIWSFLPIYAILHWLTIITINTEVYYLFIRVILYFQFW